MNNATLRVLRAFPTPPQETYGRELSQRTGLGSGTVVEALWCLEKGDLVTSRWETPEENPGNPGRRMYRLSNAGLKERFERRQSSGSGQPVLEGGSLHSQR